MSNPHLFLDGLMCALLLVIALFQLRFWRRTRDRLFLLFAIAFAVLAVNRVALAAVEASETTTYLYMVRLASFCIILAAIWDKNKRSRSATSSDAPPPATSG
jgi:peptidoglycan/LPS O-acetylase OafA/YrhL